MGTKDIFNNTFFKSTGDDLSFGQDNDDLININSKSNFMNNINIQDDTIYIKPSENIDGDGKIITSLLSQYNKVVLSKGTYIIKSGYPIRIINNYKSLIGTKGALIKLDNNQYEPCIYIGTKSSSAISDINIEHLEIDGNKTGNISIPATCTINYTDDLMLSGGNIITLYDKNGTAINFIEGNPSNSSGNNYYFWGYLNSGATGDERATAIKNVIDDTEHFSAVIDTSTNIITVTQNKDINENSHVSSTNTALVSSGSSTNITNLTVTNFQFKTLREPSGTLTSPVIKNNGIIAHNVNNLSIINCIIKNTLSGGIILGDPCNKVVIANCSSSNNIYDGIGADGNHTDIVINNCTVFDNDTAGFTFDTGITGPILINNCTIRNNLMEGIFIRNAQDISVTNSSIKNNGDKGIALYKVNNTNYPKNIKISDTTFRSNVDEAITASYVKKMDISSCTFIDNGTSGTTFNLKLEDACENVILNGCNFNTKGIYIADGSKNVSINSSYFTNQTQDKSINIQGKLNGNQTTSTEGIIINGCQFDGTFQTACIDINNFAWDNLYDIYVQNCIFRSESTNAIGIKIKDIESSNSNNISFTDNTFILQGSGSQSFNTNNIDKDLMLFSNNKTKEIVTFDNNKVGIGTDNPIVPMHIRVSGTTNDVDASDSAGRFDDYHLIMNKIGGTSTGSEIGLGFDIQSGAEATNTRSPGASITHERTGSYSKGKIHFKTKTTTGISDYLTTAMTINDDSNVGIGTTSPSEKLEVNGNILANNVINIKNNLMDTDIWSTQNAGSIGTNFGNYSLNQNASGENNMLVNELGPFGDYEHIWKCLSSGNGGNDGGWNYDINNVDHKFGYLSIVYFKITNNSSGEIYHGCRHNDTLNLDGSVNNNPYFVSGQLITSSGNFNLNQWYLSIGVLLPYQLGGYTSPITIGGIYNVSTGEKILSNTNFMMKENVTIQKHRAYLFYSSSNDAELNFARPAFYKINGTEPSLSELLGGSVIPELVPHTDNQTGTEDYLSALTIGTTKYKIGTNINDNQINYSNTSKLLLSYPFKKASSHTDAQINYGSLVLQSSIFSTSGVTFTQNIGFSTDSSSSDRAINLTLANLYSDKSTFYCRFRKHGTPSGEVHQHLLSVVDSNGDDRIKVWIINGKLELLAEDSSGNMNTANTPSYYDNITYNRWYNLFVIVDNTSKIVKFYLNHTNQNDFDERINDISMGTSILDYNSIILCDVNTTSTNTGYHFDGDLSDFYLFNSALSINEAKTWMNYVENNYVDPGNPAPLKLLADVSDINPSDGQILKYNSTTNIWEPKDNYITTIQNLDIVSYSNQPSSSVWSLGNNTILDPSVFGNTGNPLSTYVDHLYDNNRTNNSNYYLTINTYNGSTATESNPIELVYTPTSSEIVTQLLYWTRYSGGNNDDISPGVIRVNGWDGTQYVTLGTNTVSWVHHSGGVSDSTALHNFTFNSNYIPYSKYQILFWSVFDGTYTDRIIIGELNLRGVTKNSNLISINDITDISDTTPLDGQTLIYNSTNSKWEPSDTNTLIQNIFYFDKSSLTLSYPFQRGENETNGQTNYGSFSNSDMTIDFTYGSFNQNQGYTIRNDSNHNISFRSTNGNFNNLGEDFTIYLRWRKTGNVPGENYARLISAWQNTTSSTRLQVNFEENVNNVVGEPNNNLHFWFGDTGTSVVDIAATITADRWYNLIIVVDNTNSEARVYTDNNTQGILSYIGSIDRSSVSNYVFNNISLGRYRYDNSSYEFDGDFSDFYLFSSALSFSKAQEWTEYVESNYVDNTYSGNPIPINFLSNVSNTTPNNGQILKYNDVNDNWEPSDLEVNVKQLSYSDKSKLLLSYPFASAANATDAQTNYGSISSSNISINATGTFQTGTGYSLDASLNNDIRITHQNSNFVTTSDNYTIYVRWRKHGNDSSDAYARILFVKDSNNVQYISLNYEENNSGTGEPNAALRVKIGDGVNYDQITPFGSNTSTDTIPNDVWYHSFITISQNSARLYMNTNGGSVLDVFHISSNPNLKNINNFSLGYHAINNNSHLDGNISDFYLFNNVLSITEAQEWADYVDRGYINSSSPANLEYLKNVSETTPVNGESLIYNGVNNKWEPKKTGLTTVETLQDYVSFTKQPNITVWSVGSNTTSGTDSYNNLYDGLRNYTGSSGSDTYYMEKTSEGTSVDPFELIYTPETSQILTEIQVWASTGSNHADNDLYPKTIRVMGYLDGVYTNLGSQTIGSNFIDNSGDNVTTTNSLHNFTFNEKRIAYTKYKFDMYDVYDVRSGTNYVKLGELNLRGVVINNNLSKLSDINNVSLTTPTDGQALIYDSTTSKWGPGVLSLSSGTTTLEKSYTTKSLISILGLLSDLDISAEPDYVSGIKLIDNWDTTNGQYINKGDNFTYSNGIITCERSGMYKIKCSLNFYGTNAERGVVLKIYINGNVSYNSSGKEYSSIDSHGYHDSNATYSNISFNKIIQITDTNAQIRATVVSESNQTSNVLNHGAVFEIEEIIEQTNTTVVESNNAECIKLLDQARYWVVAGENADRNNNYTLHTVGSGWTTGTDNDGYTWAQGNYDNCKQITDSNAFIDIYDTTLTYAFVADFVIPSTNTNWGNSQEVVVMQDPQNNTNFNHTVYFVHGDNSTNYGQTRGNLIYDNFTPSNNNTDGNLSTNALMSDMSGYLGQKNLYVITIEPGDTYEVKSTFYVNGNFVQSVESNEIFDPSVTIQSIKFGSTKSSGHPGGQSKFYGIAAWPRKLSGNEISQLKISELLKSRPNYVTAGISTTLTPEHNQILKYNSNTSQYEPTTIRPVEDTPFLGGTNNNTVTIVSESISHAAAASYNYSVGGLYDNMLQASGSPNGIYYVDQNAGWTTSSTWYWQFTINESKIVKYVRIWPFGSYVSGKVWNLYGSNDNGTTFTFIGTHQITNYPTQISFPNGTTASGNELYSVRLGFDENNTHYNTYKLEVTSYNSGSGRFSVREIQFGEHKYKTINHAYIQREDVGSFTLPAATTHNTVLNYTPVRAQESLTNLFSVTITPSSINSKICIQIYLTFDVSPDANYTDSDVHKAQFNLDRAIGNESIGNNLLYSKDPNASINSSYTLGGPDGISSEDYSYNSKTTEIRYYDNPNTTNSVTYTLMVGHQNQTSGAKFMFNQSSRALYGNGYWSDTGISTFSAQEIDAAPQLSNVSTTGAEAGQLLMYNTSNQWVPTTNIGIGTHTPISPMHIRINDPYSIVDASDSAGRFDDYHLIMNKIGGTSTGSEIGLGFDIQSSAEALTTRSPGASITHERTDSYSKGKLHFKTKTTTGETDYLSTAMTINDNSGVGIGITDPTSRVDIQYGGSGDVQNNITDVSRYNLNLGISHGANGTNSGGICITDSRNSTRVLSSIVGYDDGSSSRTALNFNVYNGSSLIEGMRINSSGNVGIGTTIPSAKLHIRSNTTGQSSLLILENNTTNWGGNDDGASIEFRTYETGNGMTRSQAKILIADPTTNDSGDADLVFQTRGTGSVTEKMRIESSGNVGIGITSPTEKLDVNGNIRAGSSLYVDGNTYYGASVRQMINLYNSTYGIGVQSATMYFRTNSDFQFYKGGTHDNSYGSPGSGGTSLLTIKNTGNVGIGTTDPTSKLHINYTNNELKISDGNIIYGREENIWRRDTQSDAEIYYPSREHSIVRNANLNYRNTGDNGVRYDTHKIVLGYSDTYDFGSNGYYPTYNAIKFQTVPGWDETATGGTTLNTNMIILSNGNVGIGTTSPEALLHISSGTTGSCELILEADTDNNNESDNARILFRQDGGYIWSMIGASPSTDNELILANSAGSNSGGIVFKTANTYTSNVDRAYENATEVMRIHSNQNVGIGTTNPTSKLHVNGDINIVGNLKINDSNISIDNLDDVTVSGTPVHNDVLSYQSGQWTNRTMHNRNYQYKQQEGLFQTSVTTQGQFVELQGFHGSDAISITPLTSGSTIKIRFIIRGEFQWSTSSTSDESFRLLWNIKKIVNGISSTLNAPQDPNNTHIQETLANQEVGYQGNDSNTTMDTYNICFFDTNGANAGQTITYIPQITIKDNFSSSNIFYLNSVINTTYNSSYLYSEKTISTSEAEEILTGPPLTTNNVAVPTTNLNNNDVLSYQSGQWTNTAMHTRNYQYKLQTGTYTTSHSGRSFYDVNGFNGSDALQITILKANTKLRLHLFVNGATSYDTSNDAMHNLRFQFTRAAANHSTVYLNAPISGSRTSTLATAQIGISSTDHGVLHNWEIIYIDDLSGYSAGETITYTPQIGTTIDDANGGTFYLNRTEHDGSNRYYERTVSIFEAEEILTGPPLQVNSNVVPINPTNGHFIQWNGSAYTTAFPAFPWFRMHLGSTYSTSFSGDITNLFPYSDQSTHNIFTYNNYQVTIPAGTYFFAASIGMYGPDSGYFWFELHMSTTSGFTPSGTTRLHSTISGAAGSYYTVASNYVFTVSQTSYCKIKLDKSGSGTSNIYSFQNANGGRGSSCHFIKIG